jgi:hypothetical protein
MIDRGSFATNECVPTFSAALLFEGSLESIVVPMLEQRGEHFAFAGHVGRRERIVSNSHFGRAWGSWNAHTTLRRLRVREAFEALRAPSLPPVATITGWRLDMESQLRVLRCLNSGEKRSASDCLEPMKMRMRFGQNAAVRSDHHRS